MRRFLVVFCLFVTVVSTSTAVRAEDQGCTQAVAIAQDVALNALRTGSLSQKEFSRLTDEIVQNGGRCDEHRKAQFEEMAAMLRDLVE